MYNEVRWTHTSKYGLIGPTQLFGYHVRDTLTLALKRALAQMTVGLLCLSILLPLYHTNDLMMSDKVPTEHFVPAYD